MANEHVISGLVTKRATLASKLEKLRDQITQVKGEIATLDCAIQIFDPEYAIKDIKNIRKRAQNKFFETGERSTAILDVLREAKKPLSSHDIASEIVKLRDMNLQDADFKKLISSLHDGVRQLRLKGVIRESSEVNGSPRYEVKLD